MASLFGRFLFATLAFATLTQFASGAVVFRSGDRGKFVAPGEEQVSGNAQQLFQIAQQAEQKGNYHKAAAAYRSLFHHYPKDALAAGSAFKYAEMIEKMGHNYINAADAYRVVVERYPNSPNFNDAIEAQFRIGEMYLNGQKIKVLGISVANSLDHAVEIFAAIIRTAPYGKFTARAQFDIGRAREKEGAQLAAIQAYQAVVEKFPNSPVAPDAQYQIGYIWMVAAQGGTKDSAAAGNARTAFQDFLFKYPNSEKGAQARANLGLLEHKVTNSSLDIAKYYDKQKYYRAAVIYYNEVIRQQPGSVESEKARKRLDELTKKLGANALQPAYAAAEAEAAKKKEAEKGSRGQPAPAGSANESAPLPPPSDSSSSSSSPDNSLPPPAPPMPDDSTSGPPPSGTSDTGGGAATSSTPEPGATPDSSPAPTP